MNGRFPTPDGRVRIVPSLLAADFGSLTDAVRRIESAGADWASIDVMDGHFVPNLSFGPDHVRALRGRTSMALDAHLMVDNPQWFVPMFVQAGADLVIIHLEACPHPKALIREIHRRDAAAGLAIKPGTPASKLIPFLGDIDLALVMTVEPGFGGQKFRKDVLPKIRMLRKAMVAAQSRNRREPWLMVDGGINAETAALAVRAGADALVAGTSVFRTSDPTAAFRKICRAAQAAFK